MAVAPRQELLIVANPSATNARLTFSIFPFLSINPALLVKPINAAVLSKTSTMVNEKITEMIP
ncbi:hypothetical protein D1872_196150 [compost metagenome]